MKDVFVQFLLFRSLLKIAGAIDKRRFFKYSSYFPFQGEKMNTLKPQYAANH